MANEQLSGKDLETINRDMSELKMIIQDVEKAIKAEVPHVDTLEERCKECLRRLEKLKKQYFREVI